MTEVYLKFNVESNEYDCYDVITDEFIQTLSVGDSFMLIYDKHDLEIPGRIKYHPIHGYYWIDSEDLMEQLLTTDIRGYI